MKYCTCLYKLEYYAAATSCCFKFLVKCMPLTSKVQVHFKYTEQAHKTSPNKEFELS